MKGRERFKAVLESDETDKVPTFLFDLSLGMDVLKIPTTEVFGPNGFDGIRSAMSIAALHRHLGHDIAVGSYRTIDNTIFGGKITVPEYGSPYVSKKPFAEHSELYDVQPEILCGKMDSVKLSYSALRESTPDLGIMKMMMTPFSMAATMRGLEPFLMDLHTDDMFVNDLISFETEVFRIVVEELMGLDTDATILVAPYDDADMLGPDIMKKLAFPGMKESIEETRRDGLPVMFHHHGTFLSERGRSALRDILSLRPDCFYYGEENDHSIMSQETSGKCTVAGGIDTFTTIYLGPDERVKRDTEEMLSKMKNKNFIFSCSCSVDRGLPLDRMKIMMDTVRSVSSLKK